MAATYGGGLWWRDVYFPLSKQCITLWWHKNQLIVTMSKQSYATFTGCVWCYGNKKTKKKGRHTGWTSWLVHGGTFVSLSSFKRLFVFFCFVKFVTIQGWAVMDIQRTRTASETGTGRQFDTTQRHLITAVVNKTQFQSRLFVEKLRRTVLVFTHMQFFFFFFFISADFL